MPETRILVIEDDPTVRDVVRRYLERDGHTVLQAEDGPSGLAMARADKPDLIVLDVMLPGLSGLEVCSALRVTDNNTTPIIMLTALGEEDDRISGLALGADDYVTKPFSVKELALRVQSVLRRASGPATNDGHVGVVTDGDLTINTVSRTVHLGGRIVALTIREFDLLQFFLTHRGEVFSRTDLLKRVWGWNFGDHSTVTVHIKRLRYKIETTPATPTRIATVYGLGYRYDGMEGTAS
ncbi:MAG: response regulator transcription factor [Aeromicrobium sp.]